METTLLKERPIVPNREALRALYAEAVAEINATRDTKLNTEFHAKIKDAIFNVGFAALADCHTNTKRMHTISAPPGAGKTSFSYAFIVALTRYAEVNPDAPHGCVYVVDHIARAEKVHQELSELLPGKVAVWFTGHDFDRALLKFFPVAVVTHSFFVDVNGHHARNVDRYRDGRFRQRALRSAHAGRRGSGGVPRETTRHPTRVKTSYDCSG
jgi:DNA-dependent RNA polymerase auxiliary subunit epsilon